jgi:hypothetical protein
VRHIAAISISLDSKKGNKAAKNPVMGPPVQRGQLPNPPNQVGQPVVNNQQLNPQFNQVPMPMAMGQPVVHGVIHQQPVVNNNHQPFVNNNQLNGMQQPFVNNQQVNGNNALGNKEDEAMMTEEEKEWKKIEQERKAALDYERRQVCDNETLNTNSHYYLYIFEDGHFYGVMCI